MKVVKFNQPDRGAVATPARTHEGGTAWVPPTLTELAFTAACTYAGEDTFYESGEQRLDRLVDLVRAATEQDPAAVARFVPELRERYLVRSASVVVACEYAQRVRELGYPDYAPDVATVVDSACARADEPAEVVAYWRSRFGTERAGQRRASLPAGVRKGLARAATRLYTPAAALKWNGSGSVQMGDVVQLAHPEPRDQEQRSLFKWLLDQRRHGDVGPAEDAGRVKLERSVLDDVPTLALSHYVGQVPEDQRRAFLRERPADLARAGYTWERLSGWLPGGMDREAWESVLPRMGVMALLRNLRNFDDVGISRAARETVLAKLTSAEDVVQSRVLPYRAYTAYNQVPSDEWKLPLGTTLDLASQNVPELDGAVLAIDTSASMRSGGLSKRSVVMPITVAALQAACLAKRAGKRVDVVLYGDTSISLDQVDPQWRKRSTLAVVQLVERSIGIVGHATYGNRAVAQHFDTARHRQAVLFTDGQMHDGDQLIRHVPHVTTFLVGGYAPVSTWGPGRVTVAGFSDQVMRVVAEHVRSGVVTGRT